MKQLKRVFFSLCILFSLLFAQVGVGYSQTYRCDIKNINYPTSNTLEFDIWFQNTGSNTYLLQSFQAGIEFNYNGLANGGVITGSFVAGSNALTAPQNNLSTNTTVNPTSKQFRITASIQTASSLAASITSTPLKYGTFRLTNTQPFTIGATPNFIWSFITASNRTRTSVSCWTNGAGSGASITTQTDGGTPNANNLTAPYNYIAGPQHYVESNPPVTSGCPSIVIGSVTDPVCYGGTGAVAVNMSSSSSGVFSVDGGANQNFSNATSFPVTGLSQGNHTIVVTANGCSAITLPCTIGGPTAPLTNTTTLSVCDNYFWPVNGTTYTQSGTYIGTSINGQGCTVNETLNLTVNSTITNTTTAASCANYTWLVNNVTYTQSGTYVDTISNSNGCLHTETLNLTINPTPNITTSATPSSIIAGASSVLSATGGVSYVWMPGNLTGSPTVTPSSSTIYTVTASSAQGCTNTATQLVSVIPGSYRCDVKNINYPTANTIEFEIWLQNTSSNTYQLQSLQIGLEFNYNALANGGVITGSFVPGSNSLPAPQNNLSSNTSVNTTSKQFRVTASIQTSSSLATSITSSPIKYGTFRLTNTQPFTPGVYPNFIWSFITASNRTKTSLACWVNGAGSPAAVTTQTDGGTPNANNLTAPYNYIAGPQHYIESNIPIPVSCPIITLGSVTNASCYGGQGSVQINLSQLAGGTYTVDGGISLPFTSGNSFIIGTLSQGSHTLVISPSSCPPTTLNVTIGGPTSPLSNLTTLTACDSYTWTVNGNTYTQSGTYTGNSINGQGCTVNETLQLTINSSTSTLNNITACNTYTWSLNGITYTQSGTYSVSSLNAAGCTHTEILNLTIQQDTYSSNTVSACDHYTWNVNNTLYTQSGIYYSQSTTAFGCLHIDTLILTILPNPFVNTTATPAVIYLGGTSTLTANGGSSYLWMPGNLIGSPVVSPATTTEYTVTVTGSNGCTSSATQTVSVNLNTYRCDIKNITYPTPYTLEFDVWLQNTGINTYLLQALQMGIEFNYNGLANSGTITGSFVPGSNSLPAPQNNLSINTNVNTVTKQLRITASIQPSSSAATAITSTPLKYGTFRLTCTTPLTPGVTPNFIWSFINTANRTKTGLTCWKNGSPSGLGITTQTTGGTPNASAPADPFNYIAGPQHFIENNPAVPCPIVTMSSVTDPVCYGGTGTGVVSISIPTSGTYSVDGGSVQSFSASNNLTLSNLSQGNHTLVVNTPGCSANSLSFLIGGPSSPLSNSTTVTSCDQYTWGVNGNTYTQSGVYTGTSISSQGCTVNENLNLTIHASSSGTTTVTACDAYVWSGPLGDGNTYTSSTNSAIHTSLNAVGCTHTETLHLTLNYSTSGITTVTACDTYTWPLPLGDGTTYSSSNNTASHVSVNAAGCTHTEYLNLAIQFSTSGTTVVTACNSYTWLPPLGNGVTYTSSNNTDTYTSTNAAGCPHLESLDLTIFPTASITGLNATYLVSDAPVVISGLPAGGVFSGPGVSGSTFDPSLAGIGTHTISYLPNAFCSPATITVTVMAAQALVPLKVFLQGYYIGAGMMQATLQNQGLTNPSTDCDDVLIQLHEVTYPYTSLFSFTGVLQTDGSMVAVFPSGAIGNNYYVSITQRNHIQTWSASPVLVLANTPTYDFTTSALMAYGNNQIEVEPGLFALYAGDINQDFAIDVFDYLVMDPDIVYGNFGYLSTDLNGDGVVDVFDALMIQPNIEAGIGAVLP